MIGRRAWMSMVLGCLLWGSVAIESTWNGRVWGDEPSAGLDSARVARRAADVDVDGEEAAPATPLEPAILPVHPQRSPRLTRLRGDLRRCLDYYYRQRYDLARYTPWDVMHMLIAYGVDTQVRYNGRDVNAIGWLCWNQPCRGQRLLRVIDGRVYGTVGVGVEGHEAQFLAMLAQSRVPKDFEIRAYGRRFTVTDLIESEKRTCRAGTELTFKLIGLSHYLPSDAEWTATTGERWSIPRLIREELAQPISGSACGGTHRMMGFAYAVYKRRQRGESITGEWKRAATYVRDYHEYMFKLQNPNGSFSTNWFRGRGDSGDIDRYVQTTGHMLEFLLFSLPEDQLDDERVVKSVEFLTRLLWRHRDRSWHIGSRGHALHALAIYDQRMFGAKPGERTQAQVARKSASN